MVRPVLASRSAIATPGDVTSPEPALRQADVPRPAGRARRADAPRPHLDARTTGWLIAQRERIRALELEAARLGGELEVSARVERGAQRVCDRLEGELERSRQREARLARALGYAEAQRDELARALEAHGANGAPALTAGTSVDRGDSGSLDVSDRPRRGRRGLFGRRGR